MKKALLRLEDIMPGGPYGSEDALTKLKAIADYLKSETVQFQISLIPRAVIPEMDYDKSIDQVSDSFIQKFNDTIKYMVVGGASLGMHGYSHQYNLAASATGFEFSYTSCTSNCPPEDPVEATQNRSDFATSYTYSRMYKGFDTYKNSPLTLDWGFSTPHYTASEVERSLLEASSGIFFEDNPYSPSVRTVSILDTDNAFYRGVVYVPTPLGYVHGDDPSASVQRILSDIITYTENDVAAFYYHPFMEFSFIQVLPNGVIIYDDNSYLKQIIRAFKQQNFTFVQMRSLTNFIPSARVTDAFPSTEYTMFPVKANNIDYSQFFAWKPENGFWYIVKPEIDKFPNRQNVIKNTDTLLALTNWAVGNNYVPLVGDFTGNGFDDVLLWDPSTGNWQVALRQGFDLIPSKGPGDYFWLKNWAIGSNIWTPLIGDFNGDGKDDIAVWNRQAGDWQVALSDGTQFVPNAGPGNYSWLMPWAVGDFWVPLVGDFNGDGIDDIVVWNQDYGEWQVAFSNGNQFTPNPGPGDYVWLRNWAVGRSWKALIGKFRSNINMNDLLTVNPENGMWQIALCTSRQFTPKGDPFGPWGADKDLQPFVADLNGSRKTSLVARHPYIRNGTFDSAFCNVMDG